MLSLVFGTIGYALFSITVKAATRRGCNVIAVGTVNYIVAAGFYWFLAVDLPMPGSAISLLGAIGGLIFSTAFLILAQFIRRHGLSITISVVQLAVHPVQYSTVIISHGALVGLAKENLRAFAGEQPACVAGLSVKGVRALNRA